MKSSQGLFLICFYFLHKIKAGDLTHGDLIKKRVSNFFSATTYRERQEILFVKFNLMILFKAKFTVSNFTMLRKWL